jgi:signal recognition particle receptor subunit beta
LKAAKILIVGAPEAGKSTLVRLVAERSLNLEHRGRTVALDHGILRSGPQTLSLVGVPGQERFAVVREALAVRATGAVWVHRPSASPDPSTVALLRGLGQEVPYLVLVNERRDDSPSTGFPAPADLPPPREVIHGDLLGDSTTRERLEAAMWRLVVAVQSECL